MTIDLSSAKSISNNWAYDATVVNKGTIQLNGNSFTQVNVYDISGKLCYSEQLDAEQPTVLIDMQTLKSGVYFVRLSGNQNNQIFRVIKN